VSQGRSGLYEESVLTTVSLKNAGVGCAPKPEATANVQSRTVGLTRMRWLSGELWPTDTSRGYKPAQR
jgi:hypothetical protein